MTEERETSVGGAARFVGRPTSDVTPDATATAGRSVLDRVFIRDLALRCLVGVNDEERREKQDVLIQITLHTDLRQAGRTDALEDTVDYRALKKRIIRLVEESRFYLIEALAQSIANECLRDDRVKQVEVAVEKPGALRFARTVGVQIVRSRGG